MAAAQGKVIITCAVTGSIHTPTHVAAPADHAGGDRRGGARRGAGGRGDRAPARAQPEGRQPDAGPGAVPRSSCRKIKAASDVVLNFTTGGAPTMTVEERLQPALQAQARGRLAQHGLDELRPLRDARALQGVQARLGEALPRRAPTSASSRTRSRTSPTSWKAAATTTRASRSSATTSATSTPRRISSSGGC